MYFTATADTDIGISRQTNQDSLLIKHGTFSGGEVLLAAVCDGMGGLSNGELASATVVRAFDRWFDDELSGELGKTDMYAIGEKWALMLRELNGKIGDYARDNALSMGTTFSGVLLVNGEFVIAHVGDSRIYKVGDPMEQLTTDHTFVAREVSMGRMTREQAMLDRRRNLLLQCVGASAVIQPEVITGRLEKGGYLLCSDGFRHEISDKEMYAALKPGNLTDKKTMHRRARELIELVKSRQEKDNISVILIKVE
ncbi:MAG: serine/threonine-protein phosphatase [Oscillospiraceae bacterium]|nr:serine/threonine-protein phosphatase [Oscillospiraceae bacterium]